MECALRLSSRLQMPINSRSTYRFSSATVWGARKREKFCSLGPNNQILLPKPILLGRKNRFLTGVGILAPFRNPRQDPLEKIVSEYHSSRLIRWVYLIAWAIRVVDFDSLTHKDAFKSKWYFPEIIKNLHFIFKSFKIF